MRLDSGVNNRQPFPYPITEELTRTQSARGAGRHDYQRWVSVPPLKGSGAVSGAAGRSAEYYEREAA
jgi:hypothetical protein